jgi:hypothetical protein
MLQSIPMCLDDDELAKFVDGEVDAGEAARVEAHIADCPTCCAVVAELARQGATHASERVLDELVTLPLPDNTQALPLGTRVGRYEVIERVGSGATGTVYAAHDPDLNRRVALKVLRSSARGEAWRARLLREAQAMARIAHPAVVTVFDVGYHDGQLFIAMEFVAGGTLRDWLTASERAWCEVLDVFMRVGDGLAAAHAAGLVHRDFKPENVLVSRDGQVRVTDFGLARPLSTTAEKPPASGALSESGTLQARLTRTGALVGTPAYMSLEQLEGQTADEKSDVWSFCVTLYEALYRERPFSGKTLEGLREAIRAGAIRPEPSRNGVPLSLRRVLVKALGPGRGVHYRSMRALLAALERARKRPLRVRMTALVAGFVAATLIAQVASRARETRAWHPTRPLAPGAATTPPERLVAGTTAPAPPLSVTPSAEPAAPVRRVFDAEKNRDRGHPTPPPRSSHRAEPASPTITSARPEALAEPKLGTNDAPILR